MNAEVAIIKTAAETALAQAFAQARGRLPGDGAIAKQRAAAFDVFAKTGLPHRRIEDWKYTDLRALMREAKPLAALPDAAAKARAKTAGALLGDVETRRLVFVDGAFVAELSDVAALEPGLSIGSLADALSNGAPTLASHLGKLAPASDAAVALNTALMGDGAVKFLDEDTNIGIVAALTTRNGAGGEDVNADGTISRDEYKEPPVDSVF